jgi:hypothetical protein
LKERAWFLPAATSMWKGIVGAKLPRFGDAGSARRG